MKLIPNSKNYFVCEDGYVYRNGRRLHTNRDTYLTVRISYKDGSRKDHFVHRLIAQMYVPNPDSKPVVNHIDGNKHNNATSNLEWCTQSENARHALALGLRKTGCEAPNASLTEQQVHKICQLLSEGYRVKDIQSQVCVAQSVVSMIKSKKQYVDIASQYTFPDKKHSLSVETVLWIWNSHKSGKTTREILDGYKGHLTRQLVYNIVNGLAYKDVTSALK